MFVEEFELLKEVIELGIFWNIEKYGSVNFENGDEDISQLKKSLNPVSISKYWFMKFFKNSL